MSSSPSLWHPSQSVSKVAVQCYQGYFHKQFIFSDQFLDSVQPFLDILLATLVCTLALPVKVSDTQWYMHKKSICICNILTPHWGTRLMLCSTVFSSARLICAALFTGCNQHASSIAASFFSNKAPIAKELALTQTSLHTHQCPQMGFYFTLAMVSITIQTSKVSGVSLSQPLVTAFYGACGYMKPSAYW